MVMVITHNPAGHPDQAKAFTNTFPDVMAAARFLAICLRNKDVHAAAWSIVCL